MKNGDKPAFTIHDNVNGGAEALTEWFEENHKMIAMGLTKREYFAAMAMQGYCGGEYIGQSGVPHDAIAKWSIEMADELLKQLES